MEAACLSFYDSAPEVTKHHLTPYSTGQSNPKPAGIQGESTENPTSQGRNVKEFGIIF